MDKFELHLDRIKKIYPTKSKLNQKEYCLIQGISSTSFNTLINQNRIDELPKFEFKESTRSNGNPYRTYKFDIFDVAHFMAQSKG